MQGLLVVGIGWLTRQQSLNSMGERYMGVERKIHVTDNDQHCTWKALAYFDYKKGEFFVAQAVFLEQKIVIIFASPSQYHLPSSTDLPPPHPCLAQGTPWCKKKKKKPAVWTEGGGCLRLREGGTLE